MERFTSEKNYGKLHYEEAETVTMNEGRPTAPAKGPNNTLQFGPHVRQVGSHASTSNPHYLNLQEIHDTLISVAHEAGRMMLQANPTDLDKGTKLNCNGLAVDIVTETDKAVETLVSSRLTAAYPTFAFVGEETYKPGVQITERPTFIVDPIDGTTNFVHGFPSACISLGLAVGRTPAIGVVYNPWRDELYTAIRGKGAFLTVGANWGVEDGKGRRNKLPLSKNPIPLGTLDTSLVSIEWGSQRDGVNYEVKTEVFKKLCAVKENGGAMVHSLRSMGSAALNICAVAAGQLDVYWEGGCWAWDVCAGWCILSEAGGIMASGNPGNWEPELDSRKYLAVRGAPSGQKELIEEFWGLKRAETGPETFASPGLVILMMASCAIIETFHRVATQPGSAAKTWDREELIKCRAIGTGITTGTDLQGQVHAIFTNWVGLTSEIREELEQPILLASRILEACGIPWLSDFLIDDIFDENYPGTQRDNFVISIPGHENQRCPHSIVRHDRAYRATREKRDKWRAAARDALQNDLPSLIQWQIDKDIFHERGWIGYTCRHPRGDLPLSEIDKYETIEKFDSVCLHEGSRNLTILVTAEYPARLAELRRQGKAQSEEYLLTAFMVTVTILHELGHAIYWKDRRSLTRDLREPFYGTDLEMELGDSFISSIFGGWVPVPVRGMRKLREDFNFADGLAWRQALNWDHHRMRPKYRAHYSIPVEYIARLFSEASWSLAPNKAMELVRPKFLTGNSIALRTVGIYAPLAQSNRHATAAIADFHCHGDGWAWNRRPGAWFRIPQYEGCMYPELELPRAGEDAICPPMATVTGNTITARNSILHTASPIASRGGKEKEVIDIMMATDSRAETETEIEVWVRGGDESSLLLSPPLKKTVTITGPLRLKLSPRKSEYSPRKFARESPTTNIPRPVPSGSPVLKHATDFGISRKRDSAISLPVAQGRASEGELQRKQRPPSTSPEQIQGQRQSQHVRVIHPAEPRPLRWFRHTYEEEERKDISYAESSGKSDDEGDDDVEGHEISVDELKKRLSQLIGLS
ncbi:hypothetical protein RRF57_010252 [Xylaria bambusicola]|uniref:inositol-phosphate phosphatase n=1 Tax=Xylaria bambusicola TaxID=326684 RepID=A0AAN7ZCV9_9PEZI